MTDHRAGHRSGGWKKRIWSATLLALLLASGQTALGDFATRTARAERGDGFTLFSGPTVILAGNELQCALYGDGGICSAGIFAGEVGGYWPLGTGDGYIFNSGMQIAGRNSAEAGPWANDTVGVYFYDPKGPEISGTALTDIYNSLDPDDLENWPADAYLDNTEAFSPILIGRKTASQQDTWVRYWDGDPAGYVGNHPMGISVEQRSLSWTYPRGNESLIYFIFDLTNVTNDPEFQDLNEVYYFGGDDALPDGGWTFTDVYVAFGVDADIGSTRAANVENFSTAILPFDLGVSYHGGFYTPAFTYPPDVFYPPFFTAAPGLAAVKYLKSPIDPETGAEVGLTMFSVTQNPGASITQFPDAAGVPQLWRYLSGNLDANLDVPCPILPEIDTNNPSTTQRSLCFVGTQAADTRFYQSSGPLGLAPSETATIAVAYVLAPTVETMPDGSPSGIVQDDGNINANSPSLPSFHPGFGSARGCDSNGLNCVETVDATANPVTALERGAGWVTYEGPPPSGSEYPPEVEHPTNRLDQREVSVVPGSLLGRALVAQAVFDNGFLLGFAPDPPSFYLIPGDNEVTVVWEPSATETEGDPFFEITSDPESPLFNPNYREFDVEGYRIWRGKQRGTYDLVAQFDYADTRFVDFTCETVPPDEDLGYTDAEGNTLLGFAAGDDCPGDFETNTPHAVRKIDNNLIFNNGSAGGAPGAGLSRAPEVFLSLDTTIVSDRDVGEVRTLSDSGIPFVFTDRSVTNNFTYFYAVSAFDVNSMASGPHTLRSVKVAQSTVPRADAPNLVAPTLRVFMAGADDEPLNPDAPTPVLDSESGTFDRPFPPTNATVSRFVPLLTRLLPQFHIAARIDSVVPVLSLGSAFGEPTADCSRGGDPFQTCLRVYLTVDVDGENSPEVIEVYDPWWWAFGEEVPQAALMLDTEAPFDADALATFGLPADLSAEVSLSAEFNEAINNSAAAGPRARRFALYHGGSRWFDGTEETVADPARYIRVGHLADVDTVWAPIAYTPLDAGAPVSCGGGNDCSHFEKQCFERALAKLGRAADVRFTWEGGTFGEVLDVTHRVEVPFAPKVRSSWGFLTTDANGNGFIDWNDFNYLDPALEIIRDAVGGGECGGAGAGGWTPLGPSVDLVDVPSIVPTSTDGIADGQNFYDGLVQTGEGFGLYVNGERYIFELGSLPADGAVWTLRSYSGYVESDGASFDTPDPRGYTYGSDATGAGTGSRPPLIPGLTFQWLVEEATNFEGPTDLTAVHTVPDPYLATSQYDLSPTAKQLMFVNLPPQATIRIYTLTGVLVDVVNHDDPSGGGRAVWNLRNRNNQFVASGVYFFHVVTPDGEDYVGKFTIVNWGGTS